MGALLMKWISVPAAVAATGPLQPINMNMFVIFFNSLSISWQVKSIAVGD